MWGYVATFIVAFLFGALVAVNSMKRMVLSAKEHMDRSAQRYRDCETILDRAERLNRATTDRMRQRGADAILRSRLN